MRPDYDFIVVAISGFGGSFAHAGFQRNRPGVAAIGAGANGGKGRFPNQHESANISGDPALVCTVFQYSLLLQVHAGRLRQCRQEGRSPRQYLLVPPRQRMEGRLPGIRLANASCLSTWPPPNAAGWLTTNLMGDADPGAQTTR